MKIKQDIEVVQGKQQEQCRMSQININRRLSIDIKFCILNYLVI